MTCAAAAAASAAPVSDSTTAHRREFDWNEFRPGAGDKLPFHRLLDAQVSFKFTSVSEKERQSGN